MKKANKYEPQVALHILFIRVYMHVYVHTSTYGRNDHILHDEIRIRNWRYVANHEQVGFVLLLLSVSMVEQTEGKSYEKPLNCGHLECAPYRVILSRPEFEIRSYSKAMWVATPPITSSSYKDAVSKGFKILFAYIRGNNEEAVKMNMTAPVLVNIHPKTGGLHNLTYVVHFYMPQIFQRNPPRSAEAHPVELPRNKFAAVRRFGGFMDDSNISAQISALKKSLKGTAWESNKRSGSGGVGGGGSRSLLYSAAGYNSPFEYENRVNEVMLWFD